jgi:hypothetical protein
VRTPDLNRYPELKRGRALRTFIKTAATRTAVMLLGVDDLTRAARAEKRNGRPRQPPGHRVLEALLPGDDAPAPLGYHLRVAPRAPLATRSESGLAP